MELSFMYAKNFFQLLKAKLIHTHTHMYIHPHNIHSSRIGLILQVTSTLGYTY
jgi:hypothetical protein